jgi:hypothetical protein
VVINEGFILRSYKIGFEFIKDALVKKSLAPLLKTLCESLPAGRSLVHLSLSLNKLKQIEYY